jgi:predicted nucleotidyltransferase
LTKGSRERGQPSVETLLDELVADVHDVLGADLVAIYLYGSYVSGGYDPGVSDLDLVAVVAAAVEAIDLAGLGRVHARFIERNPDWNDRLEIVYVGRDRLQSFRSSSGPLAVISPGEPFHLRDDPLIEWVQNWYLVRETGVVLYGPDPAAIVPPVAWAEFVAAAVHYAAQVADRSFRDASPGALAYNLLTMCRALRTVQMQVHGSKQEAAAWVKASMPEWSPVIDTALRSRLSRGALGFEDEPTRAAAGELIALLAARIKEAATPTI